MNKRSSLFVWATVTATAKKNFMRSTPDRRKLDWRRRRRNFQRRFDLPRRAPATRRLLTDVESSEWPFVGLFRVPVRSISWRFCRPYFEPSRHSRSKFSTMTSFDECSFPSSRRSRKTWVGINNNYYDHLTTKVVRRICYCISLTCKGKSNAKMTARGL